METLAGVSLRAIHYGESNPDTLLLLHGGGANAHWWDHLAPRMADFFHVVALDFRGHGDSDYPSEAKTGAFSDDLEALLNHLGTSEAILVGHSMGARIALEHVARGGSARALVLIDLAWRVSRARGRAARRALSLRMSHPTREQAIANFQFLPAAKAEESVRRAIAERSVREEPNGRFSFKFDPRWFNLPSRRLESLDRVRCPTLLIRGGDSPLLGPEAASDFLCRIPHARMHVVRDAGHHVQIEKPDEVLDVVLKFLRENLG